MLVGWRDGCLDRTNDDQLAMKLEGLTCAMLTCQDPEDPDRVPYVVVIRPFILPLKETCNGEQGRSGARAFQSEDA